LGTVRDQGPEEENREPWEDELAALLLAWREVSQEQRDQLAVQIEQAIDRGDLAALATLTVSSAHGADLLTAAMITLAALGAQEIVDTAGEQGVAGAEPKEPDDAALAAQAGVIAALLAGNMSSAAGREAMRLYAEEQAEGSEIAEAVVDYLLNLPERSLSDQLGGALWSAQEEGRYQTLAGMLATQPASYYVADEIRDKNTCKPCRMIDGTLFATLEEAREAYPAGGYVECLGGFRCRGRYEPSWGPSVSAKVPPDAQPYHRSIEGMEDLVATAQAAQRAHRRGQGVTVSRLTGGVSAEVDLYVLDDGRRVVRKKGPKWNDELDSRREADADQLYSLTARSLDARVPRVYRDAPDVVWMDYEHGRTYAELIHDDRTLWTERHDRILDTKPVQRVGLMDSLAANSDRNTGNQFLTDTGEYVGLDHSFAWGGAETNGLDLGLFGPNGLGSVGAIPARSFVVRGHDERLDITTNSWIDNPLTADDVSEIRQRLVSLRADFDKLDRGYWLDYSLSMLDELAGHATGKGSGLYG